MGGALAFALLCVPIVSALPYLGGRALPPGSDQLAFQNVRSETIANLGASALIVEADIVNTSARTISLPAVRVSLRSPGGGEVQSWLVEPATAGLDAGQTVTFRSAVLARSTAATEVTLSLAAREGSR
jgi:hypothetical protein